MPAESLSEVKAVVVALRAQHLSYPKIVESLSDQGFKLSYSTVEKYCKEEEKKKAGWIKPRKRISAQNLPSVRTKAVINKVKHAVLKRNLDSIRRLSRKLKVSHTTVNKIIHKDLGLEVRKKKKVHTLTDVMKEQRYERAKIFISYLSSVSQWVDMVI